MWWVKIKHNDFLFSMSIWNERFSSVCNIMKLKQRILRWISWWTRIVQATILFNVMYMFMYLLPSILPCKSIIARAFFLHRNCAFWRRRKIEKPKRRIVIPFLAGLSMSQEFLTGLLKLFVLILTDNFVHLMRWNQNRKPIQMNYNLSVFWQANIIARF